MTKFFLSALVALAALSVYGQETKVLYQNDFQSAANDKIPDDFLVIEGAFAVKQEGNQKFLELPGAPLDSFSVLFGPSETSDINATARFFGTAKGRRAPTFGIGLNGVGGYRLQVTPAKKLLELYKGDEVKSTFPFDWTSGKWTHLRLQVQKINDAAWKIEGKAWTEGQSEPRDWMIQWDENEKPYTGRASVSGSPFSGTPIRFDDFIVSAARAGK
ncbi:MAG: hypothetical protein AB1813_27570 [Verrucomicrobiota bacterium]